MSRPLGWDTLDSLIGGTSLRLGWAQVAFGGNGLQRGSLPLAPGAASVYTGRYGTMEITHREVAPGVEAIAIAGKVRMGPSSEPIVTTVEELLRQGKRKLIFDLSGVTSIDSTGIGRFISCYNKVTGVGGDMRMAGAAGHVFDAFHISLLDTIFRFYATVDDAAKI